MSSRKKVPDHYSSEELQSIKELWLKDKARIDANSAYDYYLDRDQEYAKCLCNKNLQTLFRHAYRLYWNGLVHGDYELYPKEEILVSHVYKEIIENGYYSKSKTEKKKIRAWLGKAVSRQTYRRFRKRSS